ncbi:hypothetical protein OROMI_032226 [Orobanche minor]
MNVPQGFSTQFDVSGDDDLYVNVDDEINEGGDLTIVVNEEPFGFLHNTTNKEAGIIDDDNPFHDSNRPRRSKVWDEFLKPELIKVVFTIFVDNASANDSCIKTLKDNFKSNGRIICDGRLFNVRWCLITIKWTKQLLDFYNLATPAIGRS